jgi:N-acetylglucosaminyldiphosphoundecaprenol N-acetyl-beta-D-mannosaminyltransferase
MNKVRGKILGIPFDNLSFRDTVDIIDNTIQSNGFLQHVVVNVAKIVNARVDEDLKQSIIQSDLINVDGMGVVYGSRLLGINVKERVAGIDLFESLLSLSESKGYKVFFLGAKDKILGQALAEIRATHPKLIVSGSHHGYFWDDEQSIVKKIKDSKAQLLFVAITTPKKEIFINKWKSHLGVNFVMGVGGTFDIYAGITNRAPKWIQKVGLEWFFRILEEPGRMWWRYLRTNSIFLVLLVREFIKVSFNRKKQG